MLSSIVSPSGSILPLLSCVPLPLKNKLINPANVVHLLQLHFSTFPLSEINEEERHLSEEIILLIGKDKDSEIFDWTTETDLVIDDWIPCREDDNQDRYSDEDDGEDAEVPTPSNEDSEEEVPTPSKVQRRIVTDKELEEASKYRKMKNGKNRSFQSMSNRFRWIKSQSDLRLIYR